MRWLHHDEAERALIGSVILEGDHAFDRAAVEPADMFNLRHRDIWQAMGQLRESGQPAGDVTVLGDLLGEEKLNNLGGAAYLSASTTVAIPANVEDYSTLIRRSALTRRVQATLAELMQSTLEGAELLAQVLDQTRRLTRDIEDPGVAMAIAVKEAGEQLKDALVRKAAGESAWGIATGFHDLDQLTGGLMRGVLTVLAGRPSMGKSSFARKIASHATAAGIGVHVFTPEDSRQTYALRQISDDGRVALDRFWSLRLTSVDMDSVGDTIEAMQAANPSWIIDDTTGLSALDISMRVRKNAADNDTGLVVVDYVQLLEEPDVSLNEPRLQVNASIKRLLNLARSEDVAVLLLSQLNRECESRPNKRPILRDLRESGNLEQETSVVMFVYRDEVYNEETDDRGLAELLIRKNKNGPTGVVKVEWDAQTATPRPLSKRRDEPPQTSWAQ